MNIKRFAFLVLFVASCACAQIMPGIIDSQKNLPGLVFYSSINEGSGTNLKDLSANNATCTILTTATWVGRSIP